MVCHFTNAWGPAMYWKNNEVGFPVLGPVVFRVAYARSSDTGFSRDRELSRSVFPLGIWVSAGSYAES
jgi:hypothetical protein